MGGENNLPALSPIPVSMSITTALVHLVMPSSVYKTDFHIIEP